jgi:FdhD protein
MLTNNKGAETEIIQVNKYERNKVIDLVAKEETLNVYVNQKYIVTLNCSPGNLKYLATGFLYSAGIVKDKREIISTKTGKKGIYFQINNSLFLPDKIYSANLINQIKQTVSGKREPLSVDNSSKLNISTIYLLITLMQEKAEFFKLSGGVHSCGLADHNGCIVLFCEDISRYNTIDRILGEALLKNINTDDKIILTSCRITSGIMQKIIKGNIPIVISRSAPTDYAIQLADKQGVTLIGFARGERMNIYTYPERINN